MNTPFYLLDQSAKALLLMMLLLAFSGCLTILLISTIRRRSLKRTLSLGVFVLFIFVDMVFLSENTSFTNTTLDYSPTTVFTLQPHIAVLSTVILTWVILIVGLIREHTKLKTTLSTASVKEAIDTLPTGISIASETGNPLLTNELMNYLCKEILGHSLLNALDFKEEILAFSDSGECRRLNFSSDPTIQLKDQRVFRFTFGNLNIEGLNYLEAKATNVTALYQLSLQRMRDNELIKEQNRRLSELLSVVVETNREEEVLASKMHIHDKLGSCVIATRKYLKSEEDSPERLAAITDMWSNVVTGLTVITPEELESSSQAALDEINNIADSLGCRILLEGNLPKSENASGLLRSALRTTLSNAVRHASADILTVSIDRVETGYRIIISNNGKAPSGDISEGGGLSSLRNRIEQSGGSMDIITSENQGLTLSLYLPE